MFQDIINTHVFQRDCQPMQILFFRRYRRGLKNKVPRVDSVIINGKAYIFKVFSANGCTSQNNGDTVYGFSFVDSRFVSWEFLQFVGVYIVRIGNIEARSNYYRLATLRWCRDCASGSVSQIATDIYLGISKDWTFSLFLLVNEPRNFM